ncbi:hypothetical protein, variant [Saprolegnia diclina VS20]|uniref:Cyclic nucleotide-binding domain-containing protein n=1 Tax=Saprolegnia diclina (strain VS20) TaxID=1156394 RepID=T0S0X6_SAPDV|nr:hypothetical protein, variant [Saprolegnia diclina VS20]EQC38598.1 hypothetical protein, variant [Saprolegnia diclina VS20]|eukprot:XP_008608190.1 hypothetical protein, variant [Saprolegnia diclina VS20]
MKHDDGDDLMSDMPLRTVRSFDGTLTGLPPLGTDDLTLRRDIGIPMDKYDEEDAEAKIEEGMTPSPAKASVVPSAYMVRQAQKDHIVGLSPIEELKIVQGEFQARAASKYPRLSLSSRLSSRFSTSIKRDAPRIKERLHVPFLGRKRIVPMPRGSEVFPDAEFRKIKQTLHKDVESMTPEQALNFVNDAANTEFILRKQAVKSQTRSLPWFMLHPTGKLRVRWDVVTLFLLIYTSVYTPMALAFTANIVQSDFFPMFDWIVDGFFCVDVGLNFITAFEIKGILESRSRHIVVHYLQSWFLIDAASAFPYTLLLDHAIENPSKRLRQIFQLAKVLRVTRARRALRRLDYSILVRSTISSLIKFFILVMVTSHWFSCFFFGMSNGDDTGWVAKQNLNASSLYAQYVSSFYWSIMTMTTVGYGDVTGQNTNERLFSIFAMINGAWIFAYGITNVVAMVSNLNSTDTQFQQKMDRINAYMEARDLPLELRSEIREFFFNTRLSADSKLRNESKILGELSALLRSKIALAINDSVLNKMPFFEGADHNFLMELALSMKMVCFPPNEDVIIEGEIGEEMFFIFRGAVEVVQGGRQIAVLGEQQYFGEMAILNRNCLRIATVVTLCFCELRMLTREKFLLALTHYPSMRHRIAKFVHKRNQMAKLAKANGDGNPSMNRKRSVSRLDRVVSAFMDKSTTSLTTVAPVPPDENDLQSGLAGKVTPPSRQGSARRLPLSPNQGGSTRNLFNTVGGSSRNLLGPSSGSSRHLLGQNSGSTRNLLVRTSNDSTRNLLAGLGSSARKLVPDADSRTNSVADSSMKSLGGGFDASARNLLDPTERDEMSTMRRITSLDIMHREEQHMVSVTERVKRTMTTVTSNQDTLVNEIAQLHQKFGAAQKEHQNTKHELALYKAIYGEIALAMQHAQKPSAGSRRNSIVDNVAKSLQKNVHAASQPELSKLGHSSIAQSTIQGVHFKDLGHHVRPVALPPPKKKARPQITRAKTTIELMDRDLPLDDEFERIMNDLLH